MEGNVRAVRSYKKTPTIHVPATPDFISNFLSQSVPSSSNLGVSPPVLSPPEDLLSSSASASRSTLSSAFSNSNKSWSQPRLIQVPQDNTQKLDAKFKQMEEIIVDSGFDSIGEFLRILFYNPIRISGKDDPRGTAHGLAVARFLQGKTNVQMLEIIELIYSHKHSAPPSRSTHYHQRHAPFSPSVSPSDIQHARLCLFTWATNLVGKHVYQEIYKLTLKTEDSHLRASTNARRPQENANLVTWEALGKLSISGLCEKYRERAPVSWYLTESMCRA